MNNKPPIEAELQSGLSVEILIEARLRSNTASIKHDNQRTDGLF
jgi:hypothetical protein